MLDTQLREYYDVMIQTKEDNLVVWIVIYFFFQAEDGIRVLVRSRGRGDVYKGQGLSVIPGSVVDKHGFVHQGR